MKRNFLKLMGVLAIALCACNTSKEETPVIMNKDFMQLAADRYSVRHFTSQPVEQDKINLILEAGKLAPTAVNSQPQKIYVIRSAEALAKANAISPCIYGAPHVFLICYDDSHVCPRGTGTYGEIDCSIVITHMMLEAANLGIGTCPVGYFQPDEVIKTFGLPEGIHPVLLMPFGYAADDAAPSEMHTTFRPMDEMVEYL